MPAIRVMRFKLEPQVRALAKSKVRQINGKNSKEW